MQAVTTTTGRVRGTCRVPLLWLLLLLAVVVLGVLLLLVVLQLKAVNLKPRARVPSKTDEQGFVVAVSLRWCPFT